MPAWWADEVWCNLLDVDADMNRSLLLDLYKILEEETVILVDSFFLTQIF